MTILFKRIRTTFHVCIFLLAAAVLGISGYFANQFLPNTRGGFTIYSLAIPAATILFGIIQLCWAQPRTEALYLFITAVLWLAQSAWATDETSNQECFALGTLREPTAKGTISAKSFCYESRIVEAFSWTIFLSLAIFFIIIVSLANKSKVLGHPYIWFEPIDYLPWYGELPGYPGVRWFNSPYHMYHHRYGYGYGQFSQFGQPAMGGMQPGGAVVNIGGQMIQQLPGHSLVIRPSANGGPPHIEQVPGHIQSM